MKWVHTGNSLAPLVVLSLGLILGAATFASAGDAYPDELLEPSGTLEEGETTPFLVRIRNAESYSVSGIRTDFTLRNPGGQVVFMASKTGAYLPPNGSVEVSTGTTTWTAGEAGLYSLRIQLASGDDINPANNQAEFSVTVNAVASAPPPTGGGSSAACTIGDPVLGTTGEQFFDELDTSLGGPMPFRFSRYYGSRVVVAVPLTSALGPNWLHSFDLGLTFESDTIVATLERGDVVSFAASVGGWELTQPEEEGYRLQESSSGYALLDPQSDRVFEFDLAGHLMRIVDANDNAHTLRYEDGRLVEVTDGLGRALVFAYDGGGRLESVSDSWDRAIVFGYDASGWLETVTDRLGGVTTYQYTSLGGLPALLTARVLPRGNVHWRSTYDNQGRVIRQTDPFGARRSFTFAPDRTTVTSPLGTTVVYDHAEDLVTTRRIDPEGKVTEIGYDGSGRRTAVTDRLGDAVSIAYQEDSGKIAAFTDSDGYTRTVDYAARSQGGFVKWDVVGQRFPDGAQTSAVLDDHGNVTKVTARSGAVWSYGYDDRGMLASVETPLGGKQLLNYNTDGTLATHTDAAGNRTDYAYDDHMRLSLITFADETEVHFGYDAADNITSMVDETGRTVTYTYDANGRRMRAADDRGNSITFVRDEMDRVTAVTDESGEEISYSYNALGKVETVTGPDGAVTTHEYDSNGLLVLTRDPEGNAWRYGYDPEGALLSETDPSGATIHYERDRQGRITSELDPLGGRTGWRYDAVGRLVEEIDPLGNAMRYVWGSSLVMDRIEAPGGIDIEFTFDGLGNIVTAEDGNGGIWRFSYDRSGRLAGRTNPAGQESRYEYDERNRPRRVLFPAALGSQEVSYDAAGRVVTTSGSDGSKAEFEYDDSGDLVSGTGLSFSYDRRGAMTECNGLSVSHDKAGRLASVGYGEDRLVDYERDGRGLVTEVRDWLGGATTLTWDESARLVAIARPNGTQTRYLYDASSRLTGIEELGPSGTLAASSRILDAAGNVTSVVRSAPLILTLEEASEVHTYDAANRRTSDQQDALGRRVADVDRSYSWDLLGRLRSYAEGVRAVSFSYDAFGYPISRSEAGLTTSYVWNYALALPSVQVIARDGVTASRYVHLPNGRLLYAVTADGARRFYHYDEMGNTLFLTDDDGMVTDAYAYTPFGRLAATTGTTNNPFTYAGELGALTEQGNGLSCMRARWYDAYSTRFLSEDPSLPDIVSTTAWNFYQYVGANPLSFVDPLGTRRLNLFFLREQTKGKNKAFKDPTFKKAVFYSSWPWVKKDYYWAKTIHDVKAKIDELLKDDSCDCVDKLTFIDHGTVGAGPFEFYSKPFKQLEGILADWIAERSPVGAVATRKAAGGFYQEVPKRYSDNPLTGHPGAHHTGAMLSLLLDTIWCPDPTGVVFMSCNFLGEWGITDDAQQQVAQQLADRTGVPIRAYSTKTFPLDILDGAYQFGVSWTISPSDGAPSPAVHGQPAGQ